MEGAPPQPTPRCPRCGYDQSGLIASWTASCPLEAVCAECGYAFDPLDAIEPTRRRLPWLYEHARHWWSVRAWLKTALILLWPPAFWKRVRPEHEVRVRRILLFLVGPFVALIPLCAMMGLATTILHIRRWGSYNSPVPWSSAITTGSQDFWASLTTPRPYSELMDATGADGFAIMAAIFWLPVAGAFLAIPSEWSGTRLRRAHLARLLGYAVAPFFVASIVMTSYNLFNGVYAEVYYTLPYGMQSALPDPWGSWLPDWMSISLAVALVLLWPALYWFSAIRWGYRLPSTLRPFLIVLAVLLTPWTLFLALTVYYEFIA